MSEVGLLNNEDGTKESKFISTMKMKKCGLPVWAWLCVAAVLVGVVIALVVVLTRKRPTSNDNSENSSEDKPVETFVSGNSQLDNKSFTTSYIDSTIGTITA